MQKIAILYGGPSSEHEVSLASAKNILENIDRGLFDVLEVFITKNCVYVIEGENFSESEGLHEIKERGIEVIFPVLHGRYGEGGILQKKLEDMCIRFVGSSSEASSLAIDKYKTNSVLGKHGILIPSHSLISKSNFLHTCRYPIIVKPIDEGSSVGLYKYESENEFKNSFETIFKERDLMLVEEYIRGREFTCGVFEKGGEIIPLVPTEIILTKTEMFDYAAKYTENGCEEITPACIDKETMERIKINAISCHQIIGCRSISRTDMILRDNELYVLEINTIPGMTKTSFIPAQAKACGYSMKEFITILISSI